jgi:hypothetical protein
MLVLATAAFLAVASPASAFVGFVSPSGNIGCALSKSGVRCDIGKKKWQPPPKPADCDLDWGYGLDLGRHGRPHFICAGDTTLGFTRKLPYGESIRRGRFRCHSGMEGMRCVNLRNRHGFLLSRERYARF